MGRLLIRQYNESYAPSIDNNKIVARGTSPVLQCQFRPVFSSNFVGKTTADMVRPIAEDFPEKTEEGERFWQWRMTMPTTIIESSNIYADKELAQTHNNAFGLGGELCSVPKEMHFLPTRIDSEETGTGYYFQRYTTLSQGNLLNPWWGTNGRNSWLPEGFWGLDGIKLSFYGGVFFSTDDTNVAYLPGTTPDTGNPVAHRLMGTRWISAQQQHRIGDGLSFNFHSFGNTSPLYDAWGEFKNAVDAFLAQITIFVTAEDVKIYEES